MKIDKPDGPGVLEFDCGRCSSNTIVQTDGADVVIINVVGPYSGKRGIDFSSGSVTTQLTIRADAPWTATVGGPELADKSENGVPVSGNGDDVVLLSGASKAAKISNKGGKSNFIIVGKPSNFDDFQLPVNKIGDYEGTVYLDQPALVEVTSDGAWSIAPT